MRKGEFCTGGRLLAVFLGGKVLKKQAASESLTGGGGRFTT